MIYLASVTITDGKTSFTKEVVTSVPLHEAKQSKELLRRATRGITEAKAKPLSIAKVEHIKDIKGLH